MTSGPAAAAKNRHTRTAAEATTTPSAWAKPKTAKTGLCGVAETAKTGLVGLGKEQAAHPEEQTRVS